MSLVEIKLERYCLCFEGCVKLGDVLQEATLPVTVSVLKMTNQEDASRWNDLSVCSFPLGTQLTVQSIYTSTHLLANVIENGQFSQDSSLRGYSA